MYIYVLRLEEGKFFVGKTNNLESILNEHFLRHGDEKNEWLLKYKPVEILRTFEGDEFDEDKYVLKYMRDHGMDTTRGGSFYTINLSESDMYTVTKMISNASNRCFNCASKNHTSSRCIKYSSSARANRNSEIINPQRLELVKEPPQNRVVEEKPRISRSKSLIQPKSGLFGLSKPKIQEKPKSGIYDFYYKCDKCKSNEHDSEDCNL